jgi:hypothetical protein
MKEIKFSQNYWRLNSNLTNFTMYPFGSHFVYDHLGHSFMSGVGVFFLRQDEHPGASNWQRVALT